MKSRRYSPSLLITRVSSPVSSSVLALIEIAGLSKVIAGAGEGLALGAKSAIVPAAGEDTGEEEDVSFDLPQDFQYRNAMYYPAMPGNKNVYNYGAGSLYDEFMREYLRGSLPPRRILHRELCIPIFQGV